MFQNAIVRTPAKSLISGLTTSAHLGVPDYPKALTQHDAYIHALEQCGVEVTVLPPLEEFPDSCFVEDVALLTPEFAILTNPGAATRQGEVKHIEATIKQFYKQQLHYIKTPGTLEAGDVLQVDKHIFIGISARTNQLGAQQLIDAIRPFGYTGSTIELKEFLHLKTGVSYLGEGVMLVSGELVNRPEFAQFTAIEVPINESYAANCIAVNSNILLPKGYLSTKRYIEHLGFSVLEVETSEFRKVDGGLSCLSLRF